jgi:hypothetical protein
MSAPPIPVPTNPALLRHAEQRRKSLENRVADQITRFAGSMQFVYLHIIWFASWIGFRVEHHPYGLLTMIGSDPGAHQSHPRDGRGTVARPLFRVGRHVNLSRSTTGAFAARCGITFKSAASQVD